MLTIELNEPVVPEPQPATPESSLVAMAVKEPSVPTANTITSVSVTPLSTSAEAQVLKVTW